MHVAFWRVVSRESLARFSHDSWETFWMFTHLNSSHSSHTQALYYSHLNIWYLIAEIQANLSWNKANTWLNKFNFTIFMKKSYTSMYSISSKKKKKKRKKRRRRKYVLKSFFKKKKSMYSKLIFSFKDFWIFFFFLYFYFMNFLSRMGE